MYDTVVSTWGFHLAFLLLLVGTQALFTGLAALNVRHARRKVGERAEWLTQTLTIEDTGDLLGYHRLTTALSQFGDWVSLAGLLVVLYLGGLTSAVSGLESLGLGPVVSGVVFFAGVALVASLARLPGDIVSTFGVEEAFDFNQTTPGLWLRDTLVQTVIAVGVVGAVSAVVLWLVTALPVWWWAVSWGFVVALLLVMQVVYPRVIAPLFNDFEPVTAGELRDAVEETFDRAGFSTSDVYEMDASRRSSRVNAYFVGFGEAKRVVLFDTLADRLSIPQIQAVLAHELAHWKEGHIWRGLLASAARLFVAFAALGYLAEAAWLYQMFALPTDATYAGLLVSLLWVSPLLEVTSPLVNRLSLSHEREADDFAAATIGADPMIGALAGLAEENLANPFPHPLYATFHYSHPPIPERIERLRAENSGTVSDETGPDRTASPGDD
jgi:Zn-dependent protease with chaperone function